MRNLVLRFILLFCLAVLAGTVSASNKAGPEEYLLSPYDPSIPFAANLWHQWEHAFLDDKSPVRDQSGDKCHLLQSGNIWFLVNAESPDAVNRECSIPENRYLVFPVIQNLLWTPPHLDFSCDEVKENARFDPSPNYHVEVTLDGVSVANTSEYVIVSDECFDLNGALPTSMNASSLYPSATGGYWFVFKPLPKGTHNLKFGATYKKQSGELKKIMDVSYHLIVGN